MSVYVDNMRSRVGRLVLCHMMADTTEELHAMADRIGMKRHWCQYEGTDREHYDVSLAKRALALRYGAVEITPKDMVRIVQERRRARIGITRTK